MLAHQVETAVNDLSTRAYLDKIILAEVNVPENKEHSITLLKRLIEGNKHFPDAYIALAKIYEKSKQYVEAIHHYTKAINLVPSHIFALTKRAIAYTHLAMKEESAADIILAKQIQVGLRVFKEYYHSELREHLKDRVEITLLPLLSKNKNGEYDNQQSDLSRGAVDEAYYLTTCLKAADYKLVIYYAEKAVFKFRHDMISMSLGAYAKFLIAEINANAEFFKDHPSTQDALEELSACIEKYNFTRTYFYRADIYRRTQQYALAKADIIKLFTEGSRADVSLIRGEAVKEFLNIINNVHPESIKPTQEERIVIYEEMQEIQLLNKKTVIDAASCQKAISSISTVTTVDPCDGQLYLDRCYFNYEIGNMEAANLDASLAIALIKNPQILYHAYNIRISINFMLGEIKKIREDLDSAIKCANQLPDKNDLEKSLFDDLYQCSLAHGQMFFDLEEYEIAANIFAVGISYRPSAELYLEFGRTQAFLGEYIAAFKAIESASDYLCDKSLDKRISTLLKSYEPLAKEQAREREKEFMNLMRPIKEFSAKKIAPITEPVKKPAANNKKKKSAVAMSKQTPQRFKSNNSHQIIKSLLLSPASNNQEIFLLKQMELEEKLAAEQKRTQKDEAEKNRKERIKSKKKLKKSQKIVNRPSSSPSTTEDEESSPSQTYQLSPDTDIPALAPCESSEPVSNEVSKLVTIIVPLLDIEKEIFAVLESFKQYRTRVVGGSVADRIRANLTGNPCRPILDIDFATEVPIIDIQKKFPQARASKNSGMEDMLSLKVGKRKIDFYHRDDLTNDPEQRDFFGCWLNNKGRAFDISGNKEFESLRNGILRCVRKKISTLFPEDPNRILRAINHCNQRNFVMEERLLKQIPIDKHLLVPSAKLPATKLNYWLSKILSDNQEIKTYKALSDFGLLEILFSENISQQLKLHAEWILGQLKRSSHFQSQQLEFIYASFIVCAAAAEVNINMQRAFKFHFQTYINNSALFAAVDRETLNGNYEIVVKQWKEYRVSLLFRVDNESNQVETNLKTTISLKR
jgi:tetratricopeptide (TPR) repeat protein